MNTYLARYTKILDATYFTRERQTQSFRTTKSIHSPFTMHMKRYYVSGATSLRRFLVPEVVEAW
jgi:hypothetical protein